MRSRQYPASARPGPRRSAPSSRSGLELRGFAALAQTLNFRVAAGTLHISQPALTRKIKALEDKLGGPLFARNQRGVALLPAGQVLLDGSTRLFINTALGAGACRRRGAVFMDHYHLVVLTSPTQARHALAYV